MFICGDYTIDRKHVSSGQKYVKAKCLYFIKHSAVDIKIAKER